MSDFLIGALGLIIGIVTTYFTMKYNYNQLFAESAEPEDSVSAGVVRGSLLAEHGGFTMLQVRANNGGSYLGYSLGQQKDNYMDSIKTLVTQEKIEVADVNYNRIQKFFKEADPNIFVTDDGSPNIYNNLSHVGITNTNSKLQVVNKYPTGDAMIPVDPTTPKTYFMNQIYKDALTDSDGVSLTDKSKINIV